MQKYVNMLWWCWVCVALAGCWSGGSIAFWLAIGVVAALISGWLCGFVGS